MNILIFEDEIPAYEKLLNTLENVLDSFQVVGWGRSISEGIRLIEKNNAIDLIISDIELLDGHSFSIFEQAKTDAPIIFCTAFDQFLLQAFKTNGIAYLLKPYDEGDLRDAFDKYGKLFKSNESEEMAPELLQQLKQVLNSDLENYKRRFSVKKKDGIKLIDVNDIVFFQANGDFCMLYDNQGMKHVVNETISSIESKLDPSKFFRINRSEIIHIAYILKIENHFKNKLIITLDKSKEKLLTTGSKTPSFRKWIDA